MLLRSNSQGAPGDTSFLETIRVQSSLLFEEERKWPFRSTIFNRMTNRFGMKN